MEVNDWNGYWGPATSSIDWCEDNYVVSYYIAEFFNAFSSFAMIILGEAACYSISRLQSTMERRILQDKRISTPTASTTSAGSMSSSMSPPNLFRFKLAFRTITVVGIGSFLFHATLLHHMQMLDELPMLYSVLVLFFCLVESRYGRQPIWFPRLLAGVGVVVTALVVLTEGNTQFYSFHLTFGPLEVATLFLVFRVYQARKAQYPDVKRVFEAGIGLYAFAVAVWSVDLNFCERSLVSLVYSPPPHHHEQGHGHGGSATSDPWIVKDLILHAWWHIFVSMGLYLLSTVIMLDGLIVQGWNPKIEMKAGGWLPVVQIVSTKED
ncbi:Alkaline ceramidase 3 [Mortierella polycephala]|uniref:Alkaline ceramidase 3 n=1 Tax=Mortierella polycephala TaxID=41804 RepID=A0A9P6PSP7_9FUNG|nr:Alkaline ceramidase 3 [Mortierella polycephala]